MFQYFVTENHVSFDLKILRYDLPDIRMCIQHSPHKRRPRSWHATDKDERHPPVVLVHSAIGTHRASVVSYHRERFVVLPSIAEEAHEQRARGDQRQRDEERPTGASPVDSQ